MPNTPAPDVAAAASPGAVYRDAFRLLCILVEGSAPLPDSEAQADFDRTFAGEKRALAIDFWVRYPDYLADRLLDLHHAGDPDALDEAARIFAEDEPSVRLVKMIRWNFGAYESLQTSLAVLRFRGLVRPVMRPLPNGNHQHDFLVGPAAVAFLKDSIVQQPGLDWYVRRAALVMRVAGPKKGSALKDEHYEVPEYAATPQNTIIPSIRDRVRRRLEKTMSGGAS